MAGEEGDNTMLNVTSVASSYKEPDAPKLRTNRVEEYRKWKRYITWWRRTTKVPKEIHGTHITANCLMDDDSDIAHALEDDQIVGDQGLENLIKKLDDHFLTHGDSKLIQLWGIMRRTEKSASMVWSQYLKQIKKVFRDLERFGLKFEEKAISIAMIEATNLDLSTKLHIESVARKMNESKELEVKNVEESVKRLIISDSEEKVLELKESEEDQDETALWFKSNRYPGRGRNRSTGSIKRGPSRYAAGPRRSQGRSYSRYQRGERGRCYNCNSDKHYKYDCDKPDQTDNFTGMVENAEDNKEDSSFEVFACYDTEAVNKTDIIIDTGATKTVIGELTLKNVTMNWDNESKQKLMIDKSKGGENAIFKFGDERTVKKQKIIHVPVRIGSKIVKLKTYVLPGSVP